MTGYVEWLSRHEVRGWAAAEEAGVRLSVELVLDGNAIAKASVDQLRPDLANMGFGRQDLGFTIPIPASAPVDISRMSVRVPETGEMLEMTRGASVHEGVVEQCTFSWISGWAWRVGLPDEAVEVELVGETGQLAVCSAELTRPDLADAGIGIGRHGFIFDLTQFHQTKVNPSALRVRFLATGVDLVGLPWRAETREAG